MASIAVAAAVTLSAIWCRYTAFVMVEFTCPTASAAAASLLPGCASALAALPKSAPDTAQQATGDFDVLSAGTADTTAASLANDVGADSLKIEFDLSEHLPVTADVAQWQADAKALRSYCS
jgi:hypothetical protein